MIGVQMLFILSDGLTSYLIDLIDLIDSHWYVISCEQAKYLQ